MGPLIGIAIGFCSVITITGGAMLVNMHSKRANYLQSLATKKLYHNSSDQKILLTLISSRNLKTAQ